MYSRLNRYQTLCYTFMDMVCHIQTLERRKLNLEADDPHEESSLATRLYFQARASARQTYLVFLL